MRERVALATLQRELIRTMQYGLRCQEVAPNNATVDHVNTVVRSLLQQVADELYK